MNFKTKIVTRDKQGYYIVIKESLQQEDITLTNIYAPNIEAPKYKKQILTNIKVETDSNTVIVKDYNIPLVNQWTDHPDRKSRRKHWP